MMTESYLKLFVDTVPNLHHFYLHLFQIILDEKLHYVYHSHDHARAMLNLVGS